MSNPSNQINFTEFKAWLPFGGALLVLFGIIRHVIFYYSFDVAIVSYLEFSEILLLFLERAIALTDLIILLTFLLTIKVKGYFLKHPNNARRWTNAFFILHFSGLGLILLHMLRDFRNENGLMIIVFMILSFAFIIPAITGLNELTFKLQGKSKSGSILVAFFLFLLCLTCASAEIDILNHRQMRRYEGTKVFFENDTIIANDSILFVGKTRNFIFFYNENNHSAVIFPMGEVRKIEIKRRHNPLFE